MLQNLKVINLQNLAYDWQAGVNGELSQVQKGISTGNWGDLDWGWKGHENALQNLSYDW